jgi:hypothetical protein
MVGYAWVASAPQEGIWYVKIDSDYYPWSCAIRYTSTGERTNIDLGGAIFYLPAGAHTITLGYSAGWSTTGWEEVSLGVVEWTDSANAGTMESFSIDAGVTVNKDNTFTSPSKRELPIGSIEVSPYGQLCLGVWSIGNLFSFRNVGDDDTANAINLRIYEDGVQKNWTETNVESTSYPDYGFGRYFASLSEGVSHTLRVALKNTYATSKTVYSDQMSYCTFWFVEDDVNLINIIKLGNYVVFGSTVYVRLVPTTRNLTKYIEIGHDYGGFVSGGSVGSTSGTGVINCVATFDTLDPISAHVRVRGKGAAIFSVGVDTR